MGGRTLLVRNRISDDSLDGQLASSSPETLAIHNTLLITGLALAVALTIAWDGLLAYVGRGNKGVVTICRPLSPRKEVGCRSSGLLHEPAGQLASRDLGQDAALLCTGERRRCRKAALLLGIGIKDRPGRTATCS